MIKKGHKIMLTEKELRNVEQLRKDGFVWKEIGKFFDCSSTTVRKRYIEWQNGDTEFDKYTRMTWWEKLKYAFREVIAH